VVHEESFLIKILKIILFLFNIQLQKSDSSNKYPIHFAAESLDADNLRVLLEFDQRVANPTNCNELTPLHIVIDNLNDNNADQVFEAIKVLLEFDADMNCPSFKASFNTPFSLLLDKIQTLPDESKRNEILKYVEENTLYIDTTSHPHRLTNTQQTLKEHFPDLHDRLLTEDYTGMDEEPIYDKLIEHVDMSEKKFLQELCTLQQNMDYSETIFRILKDGKLYAEAVQKGQYESVKKLIEMGANPVGYTTSTTAGSTEESESALMVACKRGYWRILALMLEKAPQFDFKTLNTPLLHYIIRNTKEIGFDKEIDYYKCFDMVINKDDIDVNELDECDNTALCCAVNAQNGVYVRKILGKSAFIGYMNIFIETKRPEIPLLENIPPDILENYFDSCITSDCYTPGDDKFELKIDYSCFVSPAS
jgi:ankyrin repeat protein